MSARLSAKQGQPPRPHKHAYAVFVPTETVVVFVNTPGGPYPNNPVVTTRGQPPQFTSTVVVVYFAYVVCVFPADCSG